MGWRSGGGVIPMAFLFGVLTVTWSAINNPSTDEPIDNGPLHSPALSHEEDVSDSQKTEVLADYMGMADSKEEVPLAICTTVDSQPMDAHKDDLGPPAPPPLPLEGQRQLSPQHSPVRGGHDPFRRAIICLALLLITLSLLRPPYVYTILIPGVGRTTEASASRDWLWSPPAARSDSVGYGIAIDITALVVQCAAIAAGAALLAFLPFASLCRSRSVRGLATGVILSTSLGIGIAVALNEVERRSAVEREADLMIELERLKIELDKRTVKGFTFEPLDPPDLSRFGTPVGPGDGFDDHPVVNPFDETQRPKTQPPPVGAVLSNPKHGDLIERGKRGALTENWQYPLSIQPKTNEGNYVIRVEDAATGELLGRFFVSAGQKAELKVPKGTFRLKFASGTTYEGPPNWFGPSTSYGEAYANLEFNDEYRAGKLYRMGHTIELSLRLNGNLRTTGRISKERF